MQGLLSTSFENFAGSVLDEYQVLAYGAGLASPLPLSILLLPPQGVASWIVLHCTRFGAHVYASWAAISRRRAHALPASARRPGDHQRARDLRAAARRSPVSTSARRLHSARLGSASMPSTTSNRSPSSSSAERSSPSGRGGVWGTLAGVVIFGFLDRLFNKIGIEAYLKQVLRGLIMIAAVAAYSVRSSGARSRDEHHLNQKHAARPPAFWLRSIEPSEPGYGCSSCWQWSPLLCCRTRSIADHGPMMHFLQAGRPRWILAGGAVNSSSSCSAASTSQSAR